MTWCVRIALAVVLLTACSSPNKDLLREADAESPGTSDDGGAAGATGRDSGAAGTSGGGVGGIGGIGGMPGTGGMGGAGGMAGTGGAGGTGPEPVTKCEPNPDPDDEVCPEICPETCNGKDDDCDRRIDEDGPGLCALANASAVCVKGSCHVVGCSDGFRDCNADPADGCETGDDDPNHCGLCNRKCILMHASEACDGGECVVASCDPGWDDCDSEPSTCETQTISENDCGGCGIPCKDLDHALGATCATGACMVEGCQAGYDDCNDMGGDGCEQELDSLDHCGACNTPCALNGGTNDCSTGLCTVTGCDVGFAQCDLNPANGCEPLTTAVDCGACDKPCSPAALDHVIDADCSSMACEIVCEDGWGDCDTLPENGCETELNSLIHCGECDRACEIDGAVTDCGSGSCEFVRCQDGLGDCNDDTGLDGCEQPLDVDAYCGSCVNDCTITTDPVCSGGACGDVVCPAGTADCNQDGFPCEIDIDGDEANCGACSRECAFTTGTPYASGLTCVSGACEPNCEATYEDCDGDYQNGCETSLRTTSDCDGCGTGCAIANATATCATGACLVETCRTDYDDCDGDETSCETSLATTSNCGACGASCNLANAVPRCGGTPGARECQIEGCTQTYYRDCDTTHGNGCEIDTRTNTGNCGACGNDCATKPHVVAATCAASLCVFDTCETGWGDCTSGAGCETNVNTVANCGACGNDCDTLLANTATTTCNGVSLTCQVASCDAGFGDCDGEHATGCETTLTTTTDCGGCASLGQNEACTGLAHVTASSCGAGDCVIDACDSGWADCDGAAANGCEHDLAEFGACLPDPSCTKLAWGDSFYYVCTAQKTWAEARTACRTQTRGDLVAIESAGENTFVRTSVATDASIGASDATIEGLWAWSFDGVPFWRGTAAGSAVLGRYANWNTGEPDDTGGEDCAALRQTDGKWDDVACAGTRAFVCEEITDRCPLDGTKLDPGQCGCGTPDTDLDLDGFAACADTCETDATKQAPGMCGCNVPDTDTDGDGFADCTEDCDDDPLKQDPGTCGCGMLDTDADGDGFAQCVDACEMDPDKQALGTCGCNYAETDSDTDGTKDCNDACPWDATRTATPCTGCWGDASNFDPGDAALDFSKNVFLNCAASIDTSLAPASMITAWCGEKPTPVVQNQAGGPQVVIVPMRSFVLQAGQTLTLRGNKPVVLAVRGDAQVGGTIDAGANLSTAGAGGNVACTAGQGIGAQGEDGVIGSGTGGPGGGGGAGGGYGAGGGGGGTTDNNQDSSGGAPSTTDGNATLIPLRGGCQGGRGGQGREASAAWGGGGGGAVQITAVGRLKVTGIVSAPGGGGVNGNMGNGGGGGGSGGAILLEANVLDTGSATLLVNGGGGAAGNPYLNANGTDGANGSLTTSSAAAGGVGDNSSGNGGTGGTASLAAGNGANATGPYGSRGGGGGGGGRGRTLQRTLTGVGQCFQTPGFSSAVNTNTLSFTGAPAVTLDASCGGTTTTLDTGDTNGTPGFTNWCGAAPPTQALNQAGAKQALIVKLKGITVTAGQTLRIKGKRPVVFVVDGAVLVDGVIDASGRAAASESGPGGGEDCGIAPGAPVACQHTGAVTIGNSTYYFCTNGAQWTVARDNCAAGGGSLVALNDSTENSNVWAISSARFGSDPFIGGNDLTTQGTWKWASGSNNDAGGNVSPTFWNSGEPNNLSSEKCIVLRDGAATWNNLSCTASQPWICEFPASAGVGVMGTSSGAVDNGAGGGGGGGQWTAGGAGARGDDQSYMGGLGGAADGANNPLVGGCPGGQGGRSNVAGAGGAGGVAGGGVQISASGVVQVTATGRITVSGAGGQKASGQECGGGGGGSAGTLILEGGPITLDPSSVLSANGGGGGGGNDITNINATSGGDGSSSAATGGSAGTAATGSVGAGAVGGACAYVSGAWQSLALPGSAAATTAAGDGGGGGGGSFGRILVQSHP